jgi:2-polyprenyl-3-methyl-5-hydroxy-6-metoxy-1,4-benzoquinol methylase
VRNRLRRIRARLRRKEEASAEWYDEHFRGRAHLDYTLPFSETFYYPMWEELVHQALPASLILEIGCGTGQLAEMLRERGAAGYIGFDLSPAGIEIARERQPELDFRVGDARATPLLDEVPYDLVVCTEVLEHIKDDLLVVGRIRPGARLLATVPDYDSESHVRFFSSAEEVRKRYAHLLDPLRVRERRMSERARLFLIDGVRSDTRLD